VVRGTIHLRCSECLPPADGTCGPLLIKLKLINNASFIMLFFHRGFKALKQIVKLHYRLANHEAMLSAYRDMLAYSACPSVTRNAAEKKINSVLDFVSGQSTDNRLLQEFYSLTLESLAGSKNERLWFKTNMKLANLWVGLREAGKAADVLRELHRSCQLEDGSDDARKGTQLLEVYALEIQLRTEQRNSKQLKELYQRALAVRSAIPHPRIMGVIRECGGKMHMHERAWADAATDFFEAFKSYDEAGNACRVRCLRYLVLANMLMESNVDPFDSQEARPYRNDPEVSAMTSLVSAYQGNDVKAFEKVLRTDGRSVMEDPFMSQYVEDLLQNVRTQVALQVIGPYTAVRLSYLAGEMRVGEDEARQLLAGLILDGRVAGKLDQVRGVLELERNGREEEAAVAVERWAKQLQVMQASLAMRLTF
jgi:COP9 signalosome complex subunit 2